MTRFHALRTAARGVVALGVGLALGIAPSTPAHAQPSVSEIEAQIETQWEQLEPVIEQYNKVHSQLKANQKKSAALHQKIAPLALQADLALSRVGELAATYYKTGPSSELNALLASGTPNTFADQLSILDYLAKRERAQIAGLTVVRDQLDGQKRTLDALIEQQRRQDAELAAKKKQIDAEMNRLQKLRLAAYGSSSSGGSLRIGPCPAVYVGGKAGVAVRTACAQIGKPYVWGADGPGSFDCSGLTQYAWAAAGVHLTHFTGAQWNEGYSVSRANARPGDLVFFFSDLHHVGMYVGNGLMVHASRAGQPVKMAYIDKIDNGRVMGFRRVG